VVEEDGPDVVQVTSQSEEAASCLITPHLDLVVVSSRNEHGLGLVEVDASNWAIYSQNRSV